MPNVIRHKYTEIWHYKSFTAQTMNTHTRCCFFVPTNVFVSLCHAVTPTRGSPSMILSMGKSQFFRQKQLKRLVGMHSLFFFYYYYLCNFWHFLTIYFWPFHYTQTLDPKWNEEFLLRVSATCTCKLFFLFCFLIWLTHRKKTLFVISLDLNLITHWVRKFISYTFKKLQNQSYFIL